MDDPSFQEAQRLEQMGKYKDAAKIYSSMIDRNPSAPLYFVRGVCYYQNKKWKNAIADFEHVMNSRDASDELLDECERYLDSAYEQREIKRERNAATWAGILTGVVAVGVVADAISSDSGSGHHKGNRNDKQANGQRRDGNNNGKQAGGQQRGGNNRPQAGGQQRGGNRPQGQRGNGERFSISISFQKRTVCCDRRFLLFVFFNSGACGRNHGVEHHVLGQGHDGYILDEALCDGVLYRCPTDVR